VRLLRSRPLAHRLTWAPHLAPRRVRATQAAARRQAVLQADRNLRAWRSRRPFEFVAPDAENA
jgi:hypothetical protein